MDELKQSSKVPLWEVLGGEQGAEITQYCFDTDEVLDFCGRMLYGNSLFRVSILQIRHIDSPAETEGMFSTERNGKRYKWYMKTVRRGKPRPERYLDHTHELFGMLIAELRQGAEHIEVSQEFG